MKSGFLKNYTSDVPVSQTVYAIEQCLIKCGVQAIEKEYGTTAGEVVAVRFTIGQAAGGRPVRIRIPVNVQSCWDALWLDYVDGDKLSSDGNRLAWSSYKKKTKADFKQQAERTAWRLMKDWIEVQMSMIQMKQADDLEVFMPYLWDGKQTFYAQVKSGGFAGLLPEKTE